MPRLKVRLFGPPQLSCDGKSLELDRRKAIALAAYLAITAKEESRSTLATLLWPEQDPPHALAALRRTLSSLTKAFGGRFISANRQTIGLPEGEEVWVDVRHFEHVLHTCPSGPSLDAETWRSCLPKLEEAVDLYRDDFLAGFSLRETETFEEWQLLQSERLRRGLEKIFQHLVRGYTALQDFEHGIDFAHRWLALDPLVEEVHRHLLRLYAAAGRRMEVQRQYERCTAILSQQLGVEPEPETQQLYQAIRDGTIETAPQKPDPAEGKPRPMGARANNLPHAPTAFVGRQSELSRIAELLAEPDCRILTLVGPGGIGKTRLALEVAGRKADVFGDGVCFVPLADATPDLFVATLAECLRMSFDPQADLERQLLNHLRHLEILLLMDNFEHLLEKARLVAEILRLAPGVKLLVTSRERLNVQGEWLIEVEGLDIPESRLVKNLEDFSAVRLFLQSARRIRGDESVSESDKEAIVQICRRVGGMPLGIELAAAWMRVLSCPEIAEEIGKSLDFLTTTSRDLPERHRSMKGVFSYSLNLLSSRERAIFSRLSVFRGGFDRQAAETVAGASIVALLNLVNKSLVSQAMAGRYEMHELLRQFARELLKQTGDENERIGERHCRHYLGFLAAEGEKLKGDKQGPALEAIRLEINNIRSAWRWAVDHRLNEVIEESVEGLYQFHLLASWFTQGRDLLGSVLTTLPRNGETLGWAKTATRQGRLSVLLGHFDKARVLLEESLKTFRTLGAAEDIAPTLSYLAELWFQLGEFRKASRFASESATLFRKVRDRYGTANSVVLQGMIAGAIGEYGESRLLLNEGLVIFEKLGDQIGIGRCLTNLGNVAYFSGFQLEAQRLFEEALRIYRRLDNRKGMAFCLNNLAVVYEKLGEHEKARDLSHTGLDLFKEIRYQDDTASRSIGPAFALEILGRASFGLREYEESRRYFLKSFRSAAEIQAIPQALTALMGMARLLAHDGSKGRAWELLVFIVNHPKVNDEAKLQARDLMNRLRLELAPEALMKAEERGRGKEFESLVKEVLGDCDIGSLPA
ncbi:MAG: tetratricopeptide repeat protein [Acidobacteriota bacterium]